MLEQIINFFFQNMFFFIILLFGLSQMFRKRASNEAEGNENRPTEERLPPVSKPFFEEWLEPQKHEDTKEEVLGEAAELREEFDEVKHMPLFEQEETSQTYIPPTLQAATELSNASDERRDELRERIRIGTFRKPSRDEVAQGFIWAEILGPPRAKRKYSYRRYY